MTPRRLRARRQFLKTVSTFVAGAGLSRIPSRALGGDTESAPPVRQITQGPKHHWFGYYDKFLVDPTNRYVLGMEVGFEHRSPRAGDDIRIGMIDLAGDDRWLELGSSTAWCWQQGCMLQWRPGSPSEIVWNDRKKDQYVSHILEVKTRKKRTLPHPIYCLSPDGQWALSTDFRRLADVRPGYGYNGIPDPNFDVSAPKDTGIFRIDLETGRRELLISVADVAGQSTACGDLSPFKHWFNHLLINPDGSRFTFLHRWRDPRQAWRRTRMLTAAADGSDVRVLIDSGLVSHFIWRDPDHIAAWAAMTRNGQPGLFLCQDKQGGPVERIANEVITGDGHLSYSPDKQWILCDTGPDSRRNQHLYLYNVSENRRVELGAFHSPRQYTGEWRCDTHPCFSRDGRSIVIESPHNDGRQIYLIDVATIVNR